MLSSPREGGKAESETGRAGACDATLDAMMVAGWCVPTRPMRVTHIIENTGYSLRFARYGFITIGLDLNHVATRIAIGMMLMNRVFGAIYESVGCSCAIGWFSRTKAYRSVVSWSCSRISS